MSIEKKFEEIKSIRVFIKNTFKLLTEKHVEIKAQYKTYIDANRKCEYLDSFYFQIKLLDYDYDTTNKLYNYIDNRIYCDYYKLFIIIYNFFKLNFKTEKSEMILKNTKYPIYKDLEPYKIYDFDTINDIHQDIIRLIEYINKIIQQNEDEIKTHQSKLSSGINIDNYIHNLEYHNNIIVNNVNLYKKYLSAYHTYHISFLSNLNSKLNCIHEQLDNDINFTQPVKEKKSIIMTKICKRCSKKEAEFCETCLNEENEQYMRLSDLRHNIDTIIIDREESLENVIVEPIPPVPIDEPVIVPNDEPIDVPIDEPVPVPIDEPVDEPVPVPIDEPVDEPVIVPIDEPVIVPIDEQVPVPIDEPVVVPIDEPVVVPIDEPVPVPIDEPIDEPVVVPIDETVVVPIDETVVVPIDEPVPVPIDEPVTEPIIDPNDKDVSPRPSQLFTIYESNTNDNTHYLENVIISQISETIVSETIVSETIVNEIIVSATNDINETIVSATNDISETIVSATNDISETIVSETTSVQTGLLIDNSTNTTDIERKLNHTPPFFLDLNIPKNELTHPNNETPKKKKKHKK